MQNDDIKNFIYSQVDAQYEELISKMLELEKRVEKLEREKKNTTKLIENHEGWSVLYDDIINSFPWFSDLLGNPDAPIEEVLQYLGGLAYLYGYDAAKKDYLAMYERQKGKLYHAPVKIPIKNYDN